MRVCVHVCVCVRVPPRVFYYRTSILVFTSKIDVDAMQHSTPQYTEQPEDLQIPPHTLTVPAHQLVLTVLSREAIEGAMTLLFLRSMKM